MKRKHVELDTLIFVVGTLFVMLTAQVSCRLYEFFCPAAPQAAAMQPLTPAEIKQQVKQERLAKAYKKASRAAAQVYQRNGCRSTFADLTGQYAVDLGISPRILAALVFVESSCNPNAVSGRSSVGLTQINPKVWKYSHATLKNPEKNLEIGATILANYIHRYGLVEGLHAYNGFGNHINTYAARVLTAAGMAASVG